MQSHVEKQPEDVCLLAGRFSSLELAISGQKESHVSASEHALFESQMLSAGTIERPPTHDPFLVLAPDGSCRLTNCASDKDGACGTVSLPGKEVKITCSTLGGNKTCVGFSTAVLPVWWFSPTEVQAKHSLALICWSPRRSVSAMKSCRFTAQPRALGLSLRVRAGRFSFTYSSSSFLSLPSPIPPPTPARALLFLVLIKLEYICIDMLQDCERSKKKKIVHEITRNSRKEKEGAGHCDGRK